VRVNYTNKYTNKQMMKISAG